MDDRLERSLNLLEDVSRGIPSRSKLMKLDATASDLSLLTNTMLPPQKRKPLKYRKSDLRDMSITLDFYQNELSSFFEPSQSRIVEEEATLNERFKEIFETQGNTLSVFDAIINFIEVVNSAIDHLMNAKDTVFDFENNVARLVNERNTWLLIHALYKDREFSQVSDAYTPENYSSPLSEKDIIDNLYKQDSNIREFQMVVDWLERVAREDCNDYPKVPHFTDPTVAWENTLHQIQNSSLPIASSRQLVMSLDPDAPARENKHLHDIDHDDQFRLLTEVFKEIRMGRLDKAQEQCLHCGHAWLAAALEGWRLYHDPNKDHNQTSRGTIVEGEGNHERDVWKWVAWNICQGDGRGHVDSQDALERGIYGALCGHMDSLRPLCTSWEDQLWAYARTSVNVRVEKEIRDNSIREYEQLPEKFWNSFLTLEEIFNKLKATSELKMESNSVIRVIQELVCLDRSPDLIHAMSAYLDNSEDMSLDTVRFMAHIVLVLRMISRSYPDVHANNIIKIYVKVLAREDNANLVAFYTSKLHPEDQVEEYALFLESITNANRKLYCLEVAKNYELNVTDITHRVAQIIWSKASEETEEFEDGLTKETTEIDLIKIDALDWMIYFKEQRSDALIEANTLVRNFISQGKVDAARRAHNKIPEDSIDIIMAQFNCQMDDNGCMETEKVPPRINSVITEYLAYKAYLDAQEGFNEWFVMFHSKPSKGKDNSEEPSGFTKQVDMRENAKVMNERYESWKGAICHITKMVKAQLYNVLVFPPNGWLVDIFTADSDVQRKTQLNALRSICIPEVITLLYTLLHSMELYEDCLDLCTVIMSEEHQIYKVLSKQGLKDLVEKMSNSCLELSCFASGPFALAPPIEPFRPLQLTFF